MLTSRLSCCHTLQPCSPNKVSFSPKTNPLPCCHFQELLLHLLPEGTQQATENTHQKQIPSVTFENFNLCMHWPETSSVGKNWTRCSKKLASFKPLSSNPSKYKKTISADLILYNSMGYFLKKTGHIGFDGSTTTQVSPSIPLQRLSDTTVTLKISAHSTLIIQWKICFVDNIISIQLVVHSECPYDMAWE